MADALAPPGGPPRYVPGRVSEALSGAHAGAWKRLVSDLLASRRPVSPDTARLTAALDGSPRRKRSSGAGP
ncbi:hypothetical protein JNUCC64_01130 [Streptomyces sp. JNUCC 64]